MSKWTDIAAALLDIQKQIDERDYTEIEKSCARYISETPDAPRDALAGALMLSAHCKAMGGRAREAQLDHEKAMQTIAGAYDGDELLTIASDAMNADLPDMYCAGLMKASAEQLTRENGSVKSTAIAYNKQGICLFKAEAPIEQEAACFERADEVIGSLTEFDDEELLLESLIKSNLAECRARSEDLVGAAALYSRAVELLDKRSGLTATGADQYAVCQRSLSDIYRHQGENVQANACLTGAIKMLEKHPDGESEQVLAQLASCYNARGTLRYGMGDYAGEVDDCRKALKIREKLECDRLGTATVCSNLAEAYEQLGRYADAADSHGEAAEHLAAIADTVSLAQALMAMQLFAQGKCVYETGDTRRAMELFIASSAAYERINAADVEEYYTADELTEMEALCRFRLSHTASEDTDHNYHLAMTELKRAIELLSSLDTTASHLMELSVMHTAMGELYELFDEQGFAAGEFAQAENLREQLAELTENGSAYGEEDPDTEDELWADAFEHIPKA